MVIDPAKSWLLHAQQLRLKVNVARWLDCVAVPLVLAAGIAAATLLLIRHQWPTVSLTWLVSISSTLPLIAMAWAWWIARRSFINLEQALIRLEVHHGLHAALSTAKAGAGHWPPVPPNHQDGLRWRWMRAGLPPVLATTLVCAAWMVPVVARTNINPITEPASWNMVEADIQSLIENRLVDESSTQQTRNAIESLRQRPQSEWFDHSSIEAGDRILQDHQRDISDLQQRLREAARAMRNAAQAMQGPQGQNMNHAELAEIPGNMRMGDLAPNPELMQKMAEMLGQDGAGLNQIDPQQLQQLLDQLEQNADMLQEMLDQFQGLPAAGPDGDGQGGMNPGDGQGGEDGDGPPFGGAPSRGPGDGGPLYGNEKDGPDAQLDKPLPTGDLSRAAPGDMLGVGNARHQIDPNDSPALRSGGTTTQPGDGGGSVWSDSLDPKEQDALRKYFE